MSLIAHQCRLQTQKGAKTTGTVLKIRFCAGHKGMFLSLCCCDGARLTLSRAMNASLSWGRAHHARLSLSPESIALCSREVWSASLREGGRIRCVSGVVWLTQSGDETDFILGAGESFTARICGRVVVQGMEDAQLCVEKRW